MVKRILSVILAALMLCAFFASCGEKKPADASSKKTKSEQTSSEKIETSSVMASSEIKTSSVASEKQEQETETSSKKGVNRKPTSSSTTSSDIKVYKAPKDTVMMGCFHLAPEWCDHYGATEELRYREFREVVNEGYFNTYLLHLGPYLLEAVKIVAETGGTVWIGCHRYNSKNQTIEEYTQYVKEYLDLLTEHGLRDYVLGWWWDEPIWNGQSNADFLAQSEVNYKVFGLRNFPVFATGEFSDVEGNDIGVEASQMGKLVTAAAKYLTDIAYDSYGVEVRDGYTHPKDRIENWQKKISPNIVDGKSYYTEYKKILQKHIGHDANFWYYPCAYVVPLGGGLNGLAYVDEGYCKGHLEFMAEDVLKEKHPGGIILYTYYNFVASTGKDYPGFAEKMDLSDKYGYKLYPETEKWEDYCNTLRTLTTMFNNTKTNPVDLGL